MPRILIVDDEPGIRLGVRDFLESEGLEVEEAESVAAAEKVVRETHPDAVVLDHMLPDGTALDLLPRIREIDASVPVVVLTGHATIDLAVRAVKEGADQFLAKPVELPALLVMLQRLLESQQEKRRQMAGRARQAPRRSTRSSGPRPSFARWPSRPAGSSARAARSSSRDICLTSRTSPRPGIDRDKWHKGCNSKGGSATGRLSMSLKKFTLKEIS